VRELLFLCLVCAMSYRQGLSFLRLKIYRTLSDPAAAGAPRRWTVMRTRLMCLMITLRTVNLVCSPIICLLLIRDVIFAGLAGGHPMTFTVS